IRDFHVSGGQTCALPIYILVPVRGPLEWLQLATGVSEEAYEVIERVTKWGTKCVPCAGLGQRTATAISVIDAPPHSTTDVWMLCPAVTHNESGGRIAYAVRPADVWAFREGIVRRLSIQPAPVGSRG